MPIFEFECQACGDTFDKLVRGSTALASVTCPHCSGMDVKKKISLFSSRTGGGSSRSSLAPSCSPGSL